MIKHIKSSTNATILIEDISPYGNLIAYVESDKRTCYFYLMPIESPLSNIHFKPAALWLRNLIPAPVEFKIEKGIAPLMPQKNCKHQEGLKEYNPKELDIVWFSDGCGATLYCNGEIEAIIPPWTSLENIAGYTKEAVGFDTPFLPLPDANSPFYLRLNENLSYWNQITENNHELYWKNYKKNFIEKLKILWENPLDIFFVPYDFLPKVEILVFLYKNLYIYITVGLSRHPLPKAEFFYKNPIEIKKHSFIEFILISKTKISQKLLNVFGMLSTYPWRTLNFIDYFHSFEYIYDDIYDGFFTLPFELLDHSFNLNIHSILISQFPNIKFIGLLPATQEDFLISRGKGIEFAIKKKLTYLNI